MHYRDVVFYGLKQEDETNVKISVQIKGTSLDIIEEEVAEKIPPAKVEEESEEEVDDYEKQAQIYLKPNLKENGLFLTLYTKMQLGKFMMQLSSMWPRMWIRTKKMKGPRFLRKKRKKVRGPKLKEEKKVMMSSKKGMWRCQRQQIKRRNKGQSIEWSHIIKCGYGFVRVADNYRDLSSFNKSSIPPSK
eukprot:TRINITY_DN4099_c0_g1_i1.p2 TRINITY_DN4099_c0_g1~~TRINITY_DN4099_c0_g1_i1.p2  ORF type:complete len:189 (+),score=19.09 TRINITY_DN4099_c0_g1_i1:339-905(+)